jgi:hypothetical protein
MEAGKELIDEILYLEECVFRLTVKDARKLAYNSLKANLHLKNPFKKKTQLADKKWYYSFVKRHPELSLRQPQNVFIVRSKGFNKEGRTVF